MVFYKRLSHRLTLMKSVFIPSDEKGYRWGFWGAQSVERPTLDFRPGLHLRVMSSGPTFDSALGVEPIK